jgi:hypothetical protein
MLRLVHAITPLEENTSFLEKVIFTNYLITFVCFLSKNLLNCLKVELAEKLCGIKEESFISDR